MNCGIEVLKRLNEIIEKDLSCVIVRCERKVNKKGLRLYDLVTELNQVQPCMAVMSLKLVKTPFIAFVGLHANGHYILVEKIDNQVHVFDPSGKYHVLSKIHFYIIWSKCAVFML